MKLGVLQLLRRTRHEIKSINEVKEIKNSNFYVKYFMLAMKIKVVYIYKKKASQAAVKKVMHRAKICMSVVQQLYPLPIIKPLFLGLQWCSGNTSLLTSLVL